MYFYLRICGPQLETVWTETLSTLGVLYCSILERKVRWNREWPARLVRLLCAVCQSWAQKYHGVLLSPHHIYLYKYKYLHVSYLYYSHLFILLQRVGPNLVTEQ